MAESARTRGLPDVRHQLISPLYTFFSFLLYDFVAGYLERCLNTNTHLSTFDLFCAS
jgi:hypothetical protein